MRDTEAKGQSYMIDCASNSDQLIVQKFKSNDCTGDSDNSAMSNDCKSKNSSGNFVRSVFDSTKCPEKEEDTTCGGLNKKACRRGGERPECTWIKNKCEYKSNCNKIR